jgi:hypothetical protein
MAISARTRTSEWFVPGFGPPRLRSFLGLLFLPYTGMVLAFLVIGATAAPQVHWDRLLALEVIYFLALGIGAHALDALGSREVKPWGTVFSRQQLWSMAISSLVSAYAIAIYYMVLYVPLLWSLAILEGFFVLAYNLEWFRGWFHTDKWFAFSWGFLPVLAGYMMQTNSVSIDVILMASASASFSLVEIKASRPYKVLRRNSSALTREEDLAMRGYETILKGISLGTMILGFALLIRRVIV